MNGLTVRYFSGTFGGGVAVARESLVKMFGFASAGSQDVYI